MLKALKCHYISSSFIWRPYCFVLPRIKCSYIRRLNVPGKVAIIYKSSGLPEDSHRVPIWSPCTLIFQCKHWKKHNIQCCWVTGEYVCNTGWLSTKKISSIFIWREKKIEFIFFSAFPHLFRLTFREFVGLLLLFQHPV